MDERAASSSSEIATLKQTVSTLTAQLHNVEHDIQELQLHQSAMSDGLEESSRGNASSCSSSPAPFSPAPSSLDLQSDSPPTAAPPLLPEAYATTNSVMGPFVSVPLSVLPPRSKLHWDLCEFAAQLQADSDARLPAQLAAQRLCTATVQSLWPRAQVRPYGSHVTRLVLPSSDVDLVICLPKVRRDAPADAAGVLEGRNAIKETWQQNLARKLKQEPWVVRDSVKTLPHAAVPIITLLTAPPYNVRLDISFEGPGHNGLATNDVVLSLLHEFPPLAPMMLVLKSFAIERGLAVAYSGGLSSYALLLLVARYLQEHSDTMPNGFANASRAVQHSLSTVQAGVADFGLMLMGFLDFYGNRFDPRTTGISVASRCFLNRESTFMAGAGSGMGDPHQMPHQPQQYQQQYAADDAAVDDRTSQYGYAQHWQVPAQPHMQSLSPNAEAVSVQGLRRYGYRSSLDLPASRALDGMGAATGLLDYQQLQQQTYDPHKFDPVFIEDPLCPSNNVGRNCFRIMQIRRAFSAAHLALLAATRDPTVIAENRMGLVAGVGLHPDNILRSILGPGAPVNAKPDAATSATIGVAPYVGAMEHPYAFLPYNQQQQHYVNHHHQTPQQSHPHVGVPRSVNTYRNEPGSRRHSESESEKLTTRSATSAAIHTDRSHRRLVPENHSGDSHSQAQSRVERGRQPQRQSSLKQIHGQSGTKALSRKNSERSMSLSLSFADVVRDGGGTNSGGFVPKTSPLALARPPRFSRDDMALEESINERWETKDDSDLK
jgi:DNA polymerase sigma